MDAAFFASSGTISREECFITLAQTSHYRLLSTTFMSIQFSENFMSDYMFRVLVTSQVE